MDKKLNLSQFGLLVTFPGKDIDHILSEIRDGLNTLLIGTKARTWSARLSVHRDIIIDTNLEVLAEEIEKLPEVEKRLPCQSCEDYISEHVIQLYEAGKGI